MQLRPVTLHIPAEPFVSVPADDQESYPIPGVTRADFPGLVVNKEIDRSSTADSIRFKTTYCVSHQVSGARVVGGFIRQSDAIAAAAYLGPRFDWTRSAHALRSEAAALKPLVKQARRLVNRKVLERVDAGPIRRGKADDTED